MSPREKLIEKLAKIKAHADSAKEIGNEAEAQAFAGMLQQLLLRHKLEMTDLEYAKEMQSEPIIRQTAEAVWSHEKRSYVYKDAPEVEVKSRRILWVENLAHEVASFNSCKILVYEKSSKICFVGHKSNVEICEYLFIRMLRTADKLSDLAAKKFRREWRAAHGGAGNTPGGFRESFLEGFITRIAQRLQEECDRFGQQEGGSTALVRINKEAIQVANYVAENFGGKTAKDISKEVKWNHAGYRAGIQTANDIDINANAVKAGKPNGQLES